MDLGPDDVFFDELEPLLQRLCQVGDLEHFKAFARHLLARVAVTELQAHAPAQIAGNLHSLWSLLQKKTPGRPLVKVFNPDLVVDQWDSSHTVVHVVCRERPLLVDSIIIGLTQLGLGIHDIHSRVLEVLRAEDGQLLEPLAGERASGLEAVMYFAIDRISDPLQIGTIVTAIERILDDVATVVDEYPAMLQQLTQCEQALRKSFGDQPTGEQCEIIDFLNWLEDDHFTFLACAIHDHDDSEPAEVPREKARETWGLLRLHPGLSKQFPSRNGNAGLQHFYESDQPLILTKTAVRSTVHRNTYIDGIYIKRRNTQGEYVGEYRFFGLYTSRIEQMNPEQIPLVRRKTQRIAEQIGFEPMSHDGKMLRHILDTHPSEELFYSSEEELRDTVIGIWQIKERRLVRLFLRGDPFKTFVTCLLYLPRDWYNTQVREDIDTLLRHYLDAEDSDYVSRLSESVLVRVFFRFRVRSDRYRQVDPLMLQERIHRLARGWREELHDVAVETWGEEVGRQLAQRYQGVLPFSYQEHFTPGQAVADIALSETLTDSDNLAMNFYRPAGNDPSQMRLKLVHRGEALELSSLLPILENLGFHVLREHPYRLTFENDDVIWIHDFSLRYESTADVDVPAVRQSFEEALHAIWRGATESDSFNRLVLAARLDWRPVALLRAYARYLKQLGLSFSQQFIADTLCNHIDITRNLVALFRSLFDPRFAGEEGTQQRVDRLRDKINAALVDVSSLSEERIILLYMELIFATQRTSYFQLDADGQPRPYLSFKFAPEQISAAPRPRPHFEIFVYSQRFEGVHLRMGPVARGGLRWSNRYEDYRTEVLGLMKAQQVKNSVIVPAGAKGGFIAKRTLRMTEREDIAAEGLACYRDFIRGLLDLTDNIVNGATVAPPNVVSRDDPDPYLVVAADKGTARFSDDANEISAEYGFWLGDAFASGGSDGYDHKAMGITARGAWIAVQRHFRELGHDVQTEPFTAVGIGDMSGDVFGNGMLLSDQIRLVAAFNHEHIFIDPHPDAAASYSERQRLFNLPRSRWSDYDETLLSKGGGIYSRSQKRIELSSEAREVLGVEEDGMTPDELVSVILRAPVDLLWNGGIGTYIKASDEHHNDVGDRANDHVRVNGNEVRCRVIGEGGNLGMTQRGRIEYALGGGLCNTDFIDNSAGVDSSDHEVNIKIFLNQLVTDDDLTLKQRNQLLRDMTEEVAGLALDNNYQQTGVLEQAYYSFGTRLDELLHFIHYLEEEAGLDRELEFLPSDQALTERCRQGQGLTRPELAILLSYTKVHLKKEVLQSSAPDDPYVARLIFGAFPERLRDAYGDRLYQHSLHRDLIATQLANDVTNTMGLTFFKRQMESAGAGYKDTAMAWLTIRELFEFDELFVNIAEHDLQVDSGTQRQMKGLLMRLGRRATRWLLRNRRLSFNPAHEVETLKPLLTELSLLLPEVLPEREHSQWRDLCESLRSAGVSNELSHFIASTDLLYFGMGVADVAVRAQQPVERVAQFHFALTEALSLNGFYEQILALEPHTRWQNLAREFYVDELEGVLRRLVAALLTLGGDSMPVDETVQEWRRCLEPQVDRWLQRVRDLSNAPPQDATVFAVVLRDLQDLAELSEQTPSFCIFDAD